MTVHSVTIRTMVSGTTIVLRNEEGWIICERLISEAGLESLQQAAADLVFGSQEEQAVSTMVESAGDSHSPEYGQNLLDASSEHAKDLYRRGNQIGRGDLK